jgi:hypothetical protein
MLNRKNNVVLTDRVGRRDEDKLHKFQRIYWMDWTKTYGIILDGWTGRWIHNQWLDGQAV